MEEWKRAPVCLPRSRYSSTTYCSLGTGSGYIYTYLLPPWVVPKRVPMCLQDGAAQFHPSLIYSTTPITTPWNIPSPLLPRASDKPGAMPIISHHAARRGVVALDLVRSGNVPRRFCAFAPPRHTESGTGDVGPALQQNREPRHKGGKGLAGVLTLSQSVGGTSFPPPIYKCTFLLPNSFLCIPGSAVSSSFSSD
jgi:hypothetical protein